ncbi:hypothetical protein EDB82DRAFT_472866 [Fusarium venenatum]|uniref:uncharacterized protein n=1 Tax=Fusarium venenatum TaxID=56646 RepID=UPI001D395637|nr:hypothetical protein EDB82DRAFT_472866 [Fusarium venenatum]
MFFLKNTKTETNGSNGDFIIIGLDFGTTAPEDIEIVTSWDAELNHRSDSGKVPTQLLYSSDGDTSWGYSIPAERDALKWFKLLILDEEDISTYVEDSSQLRHARKLLETMKKDTVEVVGCFLRRIWNHAIDSIHRSAGLELLQKSRFHVVIALPAIWPPYAQQRMKQVTRASGILDPRPCGDTTLHFISEPEAAALATMKDLSKRSTLKEGDTMVICDAGGGTVDLISYVIKSIDPFVVEECVGGGGNLCGGVFLDEMFLNLIKKKVTPGSWAGVSIADQKKLLNDSWEYDIKRQFLNQNRTWPVELPGSFSGSTFNQNRRMLLELSSNDILSIYDPIFSRVETLVRRQIDAVHMKYGEPANYIILVGRLGRNSFLFNRLNTNFNMTVLQSVGNKPWTAVCRGAVVRGITSHSFSASLGVEINARIARRSYGILANVPFRSDEHLESEKFWAEDKQMWQVAGDNMLTKDPVRHKFMRLCSGHIDCVQQAIFACSEFPPPNIWKPTVQQLCVIQWTRDINIDSLPTYANSLGKVFHKLNYEIEMTCEDGTVEFTVYFEGKRVGAHNVDVQFH